MTGLARNGLELDDPVDDLEVLLGGAGRGFSSGAGISEEDHANPGASGTPADVLLRVAQQPGGVGAQLADGGRILVFEPEKKTLA